MYNILLPYLHVFLSCCRVAIVFIISNIIFLPNIEDDANEDANNYESSQSSETYGQDESTSSSSQ